MTKVATDTDGRRGKMTFGLVFFAIVLCSVVAVTPINARHDEICKQTTLYSLTLPAHKEPKMILCHPVGKALVAANNANIQYSRSSE
jgi:hypothetical protein